MAVVSADKKRNGGWPLRRGAKGWIRIALAERYSAAIRHLLRTKRGALVWSPLYGIRVDHIRTQGFTEEDTSFVSADIRQSISAWIPDVRVIDVDITNHPDNERLIITVTWGLPDSVHVLGRTPVDEFSFGPVQTTVTV